MQPHTLTVAAEHDNATLAALLRTLLPGQSWSQVRRLVAARQVKVGGDLCLDPARRVHVGEVVELLARPAPPPRHREQVALLHFDGHLVVAEKPAGVCTVRHPAERDWDERRKGLSPALEDLLPPLIAQAEGRRGLRLRAVHRIDKETSGLVVFARTVEAERGLGRQFKAHTVVRRYLAVVPGAFSPRRIQSRLIRDRGDGRRGSTRADGVGKEAVTHVDVAERLGAYTLVTCRLETGRTHQIRIHLAEAGHPVCGDKVYHIRPDGTVRPDESGAPRLALHAAELGFVHPVTGQELHWEMALPADLQAFVDRLRGGKKR
jgi:23S rRNA pseudouridine1911/1915/1917 synthase